MTPMRRDMLATITDDRCSATTRVRLTQANAPSNAWCIYRAGHDGPHHWGGHNWTTPDDVRTAAARGAARPRLHRIVAAVDDLRPDWRADAACIGAPQDLFFPTGGNGTTGPARRICQTCPVVDDCLAFALKHRIDHGVFGGLTARERRRIRPRKYRKQAVCGTDSGYFAHRRSDPPTDPCDACKAAHSQAESDRQARRPASVAAL